MRIIILGGCFENEFCPKKKDFMPSHELFQVNFLLKYFSNGPFNYRESNDPKMNGLEPFLTPKLILSRSLKILAKHQPKKILG